MTAKQLLVERVNKIIQETSGINDELDWKVFGITKEIFNIFKSVKPEYDEDGLLEYNSIIEEEINGINYKINYIFVYFNSQEEYNNYLKKYGGFNNGYVKIKNRAYVKVFLIIINNQPSFDDFYDSIHHEIEHGFQTSMMGKEYGGDDLNAYIRLYMFSNNEYERILAETIYATRTNEQDAMVNGMWGYIRYNVENDNDFNGDIDKYIINSEASKWLMKLYKNYQFIINNKDNIEFQNVLRNYKQFNINYGRLISIIKSGIKRFEKKIAMVTRRCKQRFIKEYHAHYDYKFDRVLNENRTFYCLRNYL